MYVCVCVGVCMCLVCVMCTVCVCVHVRVFQLNSWRVASSYFREPLVPAAVAKMRKKQINQYYNHEQALH
uniref:Putative secreted protein n=1 Tax=Anopheles darlingi TaxID=43151 RepID=A0A2M4D149_ANODA